MHTLAIHLKAEGHHVTGSDDEIYEPSRSALERHALLPEEMGWHAEAITDNIDTVILGMHARADNPELLRAIDLDIEVLSYPEFIFRASKKKKRIVVAGSHGKTTTTAMIMHVFKYRNKDFDFLVGAELNGFQSMIELSDAPVIVIEGDEYLSSCIDRRPKMIHYLPDISVITGIAWDHVNVFKTEEEYNNLFRDFIDTHQSSSKIFAYKDEALLDQLVLENKGRREIVSYLPLEKVKNGNVIFNNKQYRIRVFGEHNRANMMAALKVCLEMGITAPDFFAAISTFKGASKRMELWFQTDKVIVYRDFAHAPSKARASVQALREHFSSKKIIAFLELHTYSSLNADFLPKYKGVMDLADEAYVYYSNHTLKIKNLPALEKQEVFDSFDSDVTVLNTKEELSASLRKLSLNNCVLVFMSSGNFDKIDVKGILKEKL